MRVSIRLTCLFGCLLLHAVAVQAERYTIPLLVSLTTAGAPQGVVRILNATDESGAVEIYAIGNAGTRTGPATFTLNASAAVQFTAADLQSGNAALGLTGGIGTEVGDARLEIETDLSIVPLAFVRAADGTLSAMHDTVRSASAGVSDGYTYEVPIFNSSSDVTRVSRLRLINPGDSEAAVTIGGRDDNGAAATGGEVTLTLAAGGARTLTAVQLEAGDAAVTGRLGAGTGKWRLTVSSDQPLQVVNIVAAAAGYWNNLSTTAAPGAAPADLESLDARFLGNAVVYVSRTDLYTLNAQSGERFTETAEIDGVATTSLGRYDYARIGPDAGRLTLSYDNGDVCVSNLYFSTRTAGGFVSRCTGSDYPAEGIWLGGHWFVESEEGGGGGSVDTAYGIDDTLPGVPTSGVFDPAALSGATVTATDAGTTIALDVEGYFELHDGTRYTCTSADGCTVTNGTVTRGRVTGRAAGTGEVDRFPSFRGAGGPGAQSYTVGTAIEALTLPEASGGNGDLSYSLSPGVPGLTFDAGTRRLTGTPSAADTYAMTYTVTDEDGDTDTLGFTITVRSDAATQGALGVCQVGMLLSPGQSCTYPGTADAFSVNARGRGSFLGRLAGIRIRINNETIDGRLYDFAASHQGDGVWRIDRIAGSTEVTATGDGVSEPTPPRFDSGNGPANLLYTVGTAIDALTLPEATFGNGTLTYRLSPEVPGLSFDATARRLSGTPSAAGTYAMNYTATDEDGDTVTLSFEIVVIDDDEVQVVQDFGDVRTVEVTPPGFIHVSVVDGRGFEPESHGQRITGTFLDNTGCASLDQLWGRREFLVNGVTVLSHNASGIVRHTLKDDSGIFWTATDVSPLYAAGRSNPQFFLAEGRPFHIEARLGAEWIRDHDTLVISSLENFTSEPTGNGHEATPVYCDDFDPENFIPLCGALDDYIAHTGVGMEKTIFVGGIGRSGYAQAAIRPDGVFAGNTIYVESPDGSTSHATPVLAAYAANLAHANPTWSASELRSELMRIASQERVNHLAGTSATGSVVVEQRVVKLIRPAMAPVCLAQF